MCKQRGLQRRSVAIKPKQEKRLPILGPPVGSLQVTWILTPEGQRMPLDGGSNIIRGLPSGNS